MNRSKMFRAWNNKDKVWLHGYELLGGFSLCGEVMWLSEWVHTLDELMNGKYGEEGEHLIITEYCGRSDKNDKKVYEGDVVKRLKKVYNDETDEFDYVEEISVVIFREHGFDVKASDFGWEGEDLWDWNEMEVIGNIFENPELYKEDEETNL